MDQRAVAMQEEEEEEGKAVRVVEAAREEEGPEDHLIYVSFFSYYFLSKYV